MIRLLLDLYIFVLIINAILSYLPQYRYKQWVKKIKMVSDFTCSPIRRLLVSFDLPFDLSPLIVIILINLIKALW